MQGRGGMCVWGGIVGGGGEGGREEAREEEERYGEFESAATKTCETPSKPCVGETWGRKDNGGDGGGRGMSAVGRSAPMVAADGRSCGWQAIPNSVSERGWSPRRT